MFLRAAVSSHAAARVLLIHSLLLAAPSWGESSCQTASGSSCWGSAIPGGDAVFGGEGRGALRLRGGHAGCPPSGQGHMRSRQGDEAMRAATQTVADGDMAKALKQK
ncbi:hypothetical protein T484DRAFT_1853455 [Baffinella frigidus]|nr:hypothetical protein T484DRAFT_1853455 [Cryptophyta sp. CCMP2293]